MATRKFGKAKDKDAKKRAKSDAPQVTAADAVHQIWLAGLGALSRAQRDGPKAFDKLVRDGSNFVEYGKSPAGHLLGEALATAQATVGGRVAATHDSAAGTWREVEKLFQQRAEKVFLQAGIPTAAEIRSLARRIDQLSAHVESLAPAKPAALRPRPAPKRPAAPAPEPASAPAAEPPAASAPGPG